MLFRNTVLFTIAVLVSSTLFGCKKATGSNDVSGEDLQLGISEVNGKGADVQQNQANLQPVAQHV